MNEYALSRYVTFRLLDANKLKVRPSNASHVDMAGKIFMGVVSTQNLLQRGAERRSRDVKSAQCSSTA